MKINSKILIIILSCFLLNSCEGLQLKKKSSSGEEFLIEKKDPLILPPDFSDLPKPNTKIDNNDKEQEAIDIETVFNKGTSNSEETTNTETSAESGLKKSILKKIQK